MSLRAWRLPLQVAVTVGLLAILWRLSGGEALVGRIAGADPAWIIAGLLFATLTLIGGALRWRYTARRIGVDLGVDQAIREFYLAMFLNQVLPGGVSGDAVRAWRHGKRVRQEEQRSVGPVVRAVIIERVANQMVTALCILGSMALWPWMPGALSAVRLWVPLVGAATGLGFAVVAIALVVRRGTGGSIERFFHDTREALLRRDSLPIQVGMGMLVMGGCLAMFYCAAHAVGAGLSLFHLLALVPAILFAMSIPISVAGWGLREASALALWAMAGLPAAEALASSILYGVITLLSCLPGAVVLLLDRQPRGRAPGAPAPPER
jgi:uncharacterized membrane protein YbhN (UPF0104 family)